MLIGLSASQVAWEVDKFIAACGDSAGNANASYSKIHDEFGSAGANVSFRTFCQAKSYPAKSASSFEITLGRASKGYQNRFFPSGHIDKALGLPAGNLGCNIGGPDYSCS